MREEQPLASGEFGQEPGVYSSGSKKHGPNACRHHRASGTLDPVHGDAPTFSDLL